MDAVQIIKYIVGGVMFLSAAYIIIFNWVSIYINWQNERKKIDRNISMGPLVGGFLLPFSLFVMPLETSWHIWLLSFLDPSISLTLIMFPLFLIFKRDKEC